MRETRTVEKVYKHEETTRTVCDMCGDEIQEPRCTWDYEDIAVTCERGTRYPDGGSNNKYEFDVCAKCFMEKIVPLVETHRGAKVVPVENDW